MKKLLVTAFEPFGNQEINASREVLYLLPDAVGGIILVKSEVPVVFQKAGEHVIRAADDCAPDAILCLGQAAGRSAITPEYLAVNLRHAKSPDNEGHIPPEEPVSADGPAAYFSTLPAMKMAEAIIQAGVRAEVSFSAGTFVCNDLLYSLLHHYNGTTIRVGFIHLPLLPEQAAHISCKSEQNPTGPANTEQASNTPPSIELNAAVRAVIAAISALAGE